MKPPIIVASALSLGVLTKLVDLTIDDDVNLGQFGYLLSISYGLIMVYTIESIVELSSLVLAVIIAVISAGKIDNIFHGVGVGTALAGILLLGIPQVNQGTFLLFLTAALLDEFTSDLADVGRTPKYLRNFFRLRPFLEIAALIYSIYVGYIWFWAFIFIYDISYQLTNMILRKRQGIQGCWE